MLPKKYNLDMSKTTDSFQKVRYKGFPYLLILFVGIGFSLLSLFDLYKIILEPIGLHHLIDYMFPNWYAKLEHAYYSVYPPEEANQRVIMVIWAKLVGVAFGGLYLCFADDQRMKDSFFPKYNDTPFMITFVIITPLLILVLLYSIYFIGEYDSRGGGARFFYINSSVGYFSTVFMISFCTILSFGSTIIYWTEKQKNCPSKTKY